MLQYDVIWVNKTPTRLPEVGNLTMLQQFYGIAPMVVCAGQQAQQGNDNSYVSADSAQRNIGPASSSKKQAASLKNLACACRQDGCSLCQMRM